LHIGDPKVQAWGGLNQLAPVLLESTAA